MKRNSLLLLGFTIGKRTLETCRSLFETVFPRLQLPFPETPLELFSDGNNDYTQIILEFYSRPCVNYGQLVKVKESGRVVDKIKRNVIGKSTLGSIETTAVENFNSILRERVGRLVRKTKSFSKKGSRFRNAIEFFQCHWNFGNVPG